MEFIVDINLAKVAEAYAIDAIDVALSNFGIRLDWSDNSVKEVESILNKLHKSTLENFPAEEIILKFSKLFGSYIGEVYRCNHGAQWGMVMEDGQSFPGLQSNNNKQLFWPWAKVNKRIIDGAEENIWHYYQQLVNDKSSD